MKTLKVLQIASGDLWAGAEVQFYNLCRKLNEFQGIRLYAILLNQGTLVDELTKAGVHVIVLNEQALSSFAILKRLAVIVSRLQPDIIHSHRLKENVLAGISSFLSPGTNCITTIHGAPETTFKVSNVYRSGYKLAERFFITFRFTRRIYVSHELQSRLERTPGGKTRVIENGIDIEQTLKKAKPLYEQADGKGARHIGFLGRLVPVKRPDILLDIAEQTIKRENLPYVFHVIGDGPLYEEFRRSVAAKGLSEHVTVHGFHANPLPLLAGMDCLLITSDHEGLPTNLLEAMCLGIPVIAHAVGEIPRVLDYGKLGTLVEDQDIKRYVKAIRECLSPTSPANTAAAGLPLMRVKERYSAAHNAERYLRLYHDVLAPNKAAECHGF